VETRGAVLILEDEYLLATTLAEFVADAGCSVVGPAASADQARDLMNEKGIDAALLDIRLSGDQQSFELAAQLQAMRVPFAFVTAYSPTLLPIPFREARFLIKPSTRDGVATLLQQLLASQPASQRPG